MKITSVNNDRVKYYTKLMNSKKDRDKEKLFIVEGEHLVHEALEANIVKEVIISDSKYDHFMDVDKVYVTEEIMKKICETLSPQGIIALCKQKEMEDLLTFNRVLLLDNVQDPGNIGTIIRSCDAFNFDGIVLSHQSVDIYNPKVVRSTQGALFRVNIIKRQLSNYITFLKEKGVKVYGTSLQGKNLNDVRNDEKMAFIMGNEGSGVSPELLQMTDDNIFIEMSGKSESLNVAIASGIIMYNFRNK